MKNMTAVIFDLDGTLLDSLVDIAAAMNNALRAMGLPEHPLSAYRYFVGDGVEYLAERALPPERRDEESKKLCIAAMRAFYAEHWADNTVPYPGVRDLLSELARSNAAMAVLSNKPDDFTRRMVAALLPFAPFTIVRGARPHVPKKPHPAAALEIAQAFGVAPGAILYLGDTGTDMRTAAAAGMYGVGALWGFRPAEELVADGARALVAAPGDVLDLIALLPR